MKQIELNFLLSYLNVIYKLGGSPGASLRIGYFQW